MIESPGFASDVSYELFDFNEADKIRNELALNDIILEDSPSGTKWRINN